MKYPVIYIRGKGNHTARFSELTEGQMSIVGDIGSAMRLLAPAKGGKRDKGGHAFILYEQHDTDADLRDIRFLRSWLPGGGIVLITSDGMTEQQRHEYLRAGVNSALPGNVSREDFLRTLQFMTDYTFVHKAVTGDSSEVRLFRMPLWKRSFDILASLSAIVLLSPLLLVVAAAIKLDSPGPVVYKSKRVGSNYRIFDFLKFRSMRTDADRRLKEFRDLNQYAAQTAPDDSAKMTFDEADIGKLLADTENGMLYADDFAIPEEAHHQQLETEQENAFVKIENDPRITRLGRILRKYSIDELPQLFNILRGDMSVVGNRPLPLYEAERLTSDEYIERFMCPSGLTGLWQVEKRGQAGKLSPEQRKQLDIEYARKMSPWFDLKIILRTFTAFIQKENV